VSLQERSATDRVQEARNRFVARGVSTPPLAVARAAGAREQYGEELVPFPIGDDELERGLDILEGCLGG
jgi:hypothetical protein